MDGPDFPLLEQSQTPFRWTAQIRTGTNRTPYSSLVSSFRGKPPPSSKPRQTPKFPIDAPHLQITRWKRPRFRITHWPWGREGPSSFCPPPPLPLRRRRRRGGVRPLAGDRVLDRLALFLQEIRGLVGGVLREVLARRMIFEGYK